MSGSFVDLLRPHRGALYRGARRCVCSGWDLLDCTGFICWTVHWTMCSFIRCTYCVHSHSVAFSRIPIAFTRIRSHSIAFGRFLFAFYSWSQALASRRKADKKRASEHARQAVWNCIVKC